MAYLHYNSKLHSRPWLYFARFTCWIRSRRGCLSHHRYKTISAIISLFLLFVNLYIWHQGCENFQSPIYLSHGYLPVFPHHLYPPYTPYTKDITSASSSSLPSLDYYLYSHIVQDSLHQSVPPVLHIIHCDHGPFTFTHYTSVLAAFKILKPSAMFIHITQEPELDPDGYYQFLPDLLRDIPLLVKVQLKESNACSSKGKDQIAAYLDIIGHTGGVAINSRVILTPSKFIAHLMNQNISLLSLESDKTLTTLVSVASHVVPSLYSSLHNLKDSVSASYSGSKTKNHKIVMLQCVTPATYSIQQENSSFCLYLPEDTLPFQIFKVKSDFAKLIRWASYGSSEILAPKISPHDIVPNIVHYVWLGKRKLDYFTYLSFLSSLYVLEADAVYVHGEAPLGELWDYFEKEPRLKLIHRDFPDAVYGTPIEKYVSHASDYLRADILLRYGGVYADTDVIFLNKLPSNFRKFEATACPDWPKTGAFPDVFNMGVLVAAPGAAYLRYFLESYRWYLDTDWSYNAIHIPYKVYEKKPQTLNVARHLQILCAENKCHATWIAGYKVDGVDHLDGMSFDWRKDAFAIHWTHPDPEEFTCQDNLLASQSIPGDIGKMVLKKANIIS